MKICVCIPTMGRPNAPDQVRQCVERLFETVGGHNVVCIVHVEQDEATWRSLTDTRAVALFSPESTGAIKGWNACLEACPDADAYVLGADDLWWGDGWLDKALDALDRLPAGGGVVGLNSLDGERRDFAAHFLTTRQFLARYHGGVLAIPHYQHYSCDFETAERAQWAGRYVFAEDAIVEHRAWYNGQTDEERQARWDSVYQTAESVRALDEVLFLERRKAGFPDDFERILPTVDPPTVYWCILAERTILEPAWNAHLDVASWSAAAGFPCSRLKGPYVHVDIARNCYADAFRKLSQDPDDFLVMLDCDHVHPFDILYQLTDPGFGGVMTALCFRRGDDYDSMAWQFHETDDGPMVVPIAHCLPDKKRIEFNIQCRPGEIVKVDEIGMGAVAIRRWVFEQIEKAGFLLPHFQRVYQAGSLELHTEDQYFSSLCRAAGIQMACHTGVVSPHLTWGQIG